MKNNNTIILIIILILGAAILYLLLNREPEVKYEVSSAPIILSFEDCVNAGYPMVIENRRQCKTPDGRTFAEITNVPVTYTKTTSKTISVSLPYPGAVVGKELAVVGQAERSWYFEGTFPIQVLAANGSLLATGTARAEGNWMTTDLVPFKASIKIPESYIGEGTIVLKKSNASGLSENDASISFPIRIEY